MGVLKPLFHRPLHGSRGHRGDVPIQPSQYAARKPQPPRASAELHGLMKAARDSGQDADPTLHGAIADALDDEFPGSPIPDMIRRQFSQGPHAGKPGPNHLYFDPTTNDWDGSFPYAARLGKHGPFSLFLRHEGQHDAANHWPAPGRPNTNRWVLHAVSDLPGSRDFGWNFEVAHEDAHNIPRMFPQAQQHISPVKYVPGENDGIDVRVRNEEAARFQSRMQQEEDYR